MTVESLLLAVSVEDVLFDVAEALRVPVLVLALLAGVVVLLELGSLAMELARRRKRGIARLDRAIDQARAALAVGDRDTAVRVARKLGYNRAMSDALAAIVEQRGYPDAGDRIAKRMAEYDYRSMKRLERTRILVRAGPALGLMGTLIPLSPALQGLAEGDVQNLTEELRVAFSVTVAGLFIGMLAFGVSLIRDRLYAQDFSDVEYVAAGLDGPIPPAGQQAPATPQQAPGQPAAQPVPAQPVAGQTQVITPAVATPPPGGVPPAPQPPAQQPPPIQGQ
jgi:biopolymer transport protein ExbB/TolQ